MLCTQGDSGDWEDSDDFYDVAEQDSVEPPWCMLLISAVTWPKGTYSSIMLMSLVLCTPPLDFSCTIPFLRGLSTDLRDAAEGGNLVRRWASGDKWGCKQRQPCHVYSLPDPVHFSC